MKNNLNNVKIIKYKNTIKSIYYNDYYFNSDDPIGEVNYVYIKGNNLLQRLDKKQNFVIGELGFGSGLNFLVTFDFFTKLKSKTYLHYISFEKNPLNQYQLRKIYNNFKSLNRLSKKLLKKMPLKSTGIHDLSFDEENVRLTLIYHDFDYLKKLPFYADAWFLDGFTPHKNKSAWTDVVLKNVFEKTNQQGSFSTFTSSTKIRKTLVEIGFKVFKKKGFLKKREMIVGRKIDSQKKINLNSFNFKFEPVAIIGGGISGCSVSYALSKRNIECFIVEKGLNRGSGASGNFLAFQMPNLTLDNSIYGILSLRSFLFSRTLALKLKSAPSTKGILVFPKRNREIEKFKKILSFNWQKELFKEYFSKKFNEFEVIHKFSSSGIVDNKKFLKELSKKVEFISNFEVYRVLEDNFKKQIISKNGKLLSAKTIVWANGYENSNINLRKINIPVSGQVTYIKENKIFSNSKLNYSYGNTFSQAFKGIHQIGSTFTRDFSNKMDVYNEINIKNILPVLKEQFQNKLEIKGSRNSVRSSTRNRLPYFGSLDMNKELFIGGMGAWGYTYAPFLAELMVREITNEPLLIEQNILKILNIYNRI